MASMGLIIGGVSPHDLILDGQSVSLYMGGNPPVKVWPTAKEVVQITLGTGLEARNQLRAALADRGLNYTTVTDIPFDIELVGSGSVNDMFFDCSSLTSVPAMDTSQVTNMSNMFQDCAALTSVPDMDTSRVTSMENMFDGCESLIHAPDMDTSQVTSMYGMFRDCAALTHVPDLNTSSVTSMSYMFNGCAALTDGNVRLIGKHPNVTTSFMILGSGLTREPWYTPDGKPIDVYQVTLTDVSGHYAEYPLVTVTVPAGESWQVRIQGTVTKASSQYSYRPYFMIGTTETGPYAQGSSVDMTGTVTSTNPKIIMMTMGGLSAYTSFTGTVTITRSI